MYMLIFLILVIIIIKFICYVFVQSVCKHEESVTIPRVSHSSMLSKILDTGRLSNLSSLDKSKNV